jgi:type IV pilus assembly protein PilQ
MAVGTMVLRNRSYLNLSGPPVTMTLRNAPAKDALMALSQMGGYGFVYVDDEERPGAQASAGPTVSLSFRGEAYSKALNSVLLASGLQGRMEGNLLLAGPSVMGKTFGTQMSKVYRLNQASAESAAKYLASLGAR